MEQANSASSAGRRRAVLTLGELFALDERLDPDSFRVVAGTPGDIPEIVHLINTRRMPIPLPLKFARTEELLARTWPRVRWLLACQGAALVGCLELRPIEGEADVWEMGSFSQAHDNRNPRVPVKLWTAGFRTLVGIGAREAIVEIHRDNAAAWRFLSHLPFEREGECADHPAFIRGRMKLQVTRLPSDRQRDDSRGVDADSGERQPAGACRAPVSPRRSQG